MTRRTTYTKVQKTNQVRAQHVKGMGDIVFKGFQCLNSECLEYIFVRKDELAGGFDIVCPRCGIVLRSGDSTRFYDYSVVDQRDNSVIASGAFEILHDDYVKEAQEYKYCIVCNTLKPLSFFDKHSVRVSGRQGECRLCKVAYNAIKNPTRLTDQHREAAQMRRLLLDLAGAVKLDTKRIFQRFDYRCFKCGRDLRQVTSEDDRPIDHTLPVRYLWPATTDNSTLLCRQHNGEKSGRWPSEFYDQRELRKLSVLTGLEFDLLAGAPAYNPVALIQLQKPEYVDALLTKNAPRMRAIIGLRNRLLRDLHLDFFSFSRSISTTWIEIANREYDTNASATTGEILEDPANTEPDTDEM